MKPSNLDGVNLKEQRVSVWSGWWPLQWNVLTPLMGWARSQKFHQLTILQSKGHRFQSTPAPLMKKLHRETWNIYQINIQYPSADRADIWIWNEWLDRNTESQSPKSSSARMLRNSRLLQETERRGGKYLVLSALQTGETHREQRSSLESADIEGTFGKHLVNICGTLRAFYNYSICGTIQRFAIAMLKST